MICISCVTMSAKAMRSTSAASTPIRMTFLRWSGGQAGGQRADDDRIVAGEHEVDHQHLEEGGEGRRLGDVREVV